MVNNIQKAVEQASKDLSDIDLDVILTRPEEQFGDYSTNVALQLGKRLNKNPREIAEELSAKLRDSLKDQISEISVAGPGFINIKLSDQSLIAAVKNQPLKSLANQVVVAEYSDPNPFKVLHAGHIYTTVVGDAIANLMEQAGATVHRVNYGGDVGLHVAKTMWAIMRELGGENPQNLESVAEAERASWLAAAYVKGNNIYEEDEPIKAEIVELNKRVYKIHTDNDHESPLAQIYWTCRTWSYEAFDAFYARLGTSMERYYPESEVANKGAELVRQQVGKVFKESDGAIVFDGEAYGLHTRVFINSQGLPTYEAKEVGLIVRKYDDYHYDKSVIITANEQAQYMAVVFKAIEQFMPDLARAGKYVSHGMVKLAGGVKMSSRKGNIVQANEVLDATAQANRELVGKDDDTTSIGAIKYAFLKTRLGGDLVYDPKESVSIEGNSGPYLQYAHARARSILSKAQEPALLEDHDTFEAGERSLLLKMTEYPEIVDRAVAELMPHHVCTYLYELAQTFNRFYENNRVIGEERQRIRLALVTNYANTLKSGLSLLGIASPDKM
jgi:arginyl-tRNA synthetase